MELRQIGAVLLRRWYLILIPLVVGGALAVLPLLTAPAPGVSYTTNFRFTAARAQAAIPGREGDFQDIWLDSAYTVEALAEWVTATSFRDEVVALAGQNGTSINPAAFAIASDYEDNIGQIFLSYPEEAVFRVLVDAAQQVLQTRNVVYFERQLGGQPATVTILDTPVVTAAAPALIDRLSILVRLGLGLGVGLVLAFLAEYFDRTLRRGDEVEQTGLPVVGAIPRR